MQSHSHEYYKHNSDVRRQWVDARMEIKCWKQKIEYEIHPGRVEENVYYIRDTEAEQRYLKDYMAQIKREEEEDWDSSDTEISDSEEELKVDYSLLDKGSEDEKEEKEQEKEQPQVPKQ